MELIEVIVNSGFSMNSSQIAKKLGLLESAFLGDLISVQKCYTSKDDAWFYQTYEQITERTKLSKHSAKKLSDKLEELGLIRTKVQSNSFEVGGFKVSRSVRYYQLHSVNIAKMMEYKLDDSPIKIKNSTSSEVKNINLGKVKDVNRNIYNTKKIYKPNLTLKGANVVEKKKSPKKRVGNGLPVNKNEARKFRNRPEEYIAKMTAFLDNPNEMYYGGVSKERANAVNSKRSKYYADSTVLLGALSGATIVHNQDDTFLEIGRADYGKINGIIASFDSLGEAFKAIADLIKVYPRIQGYTHIQATNKFSLRLFLDNHEALLSAYKKMPNTLLNPEKPFYDPNLSPLENAWGDYLAVG